MFWHRFYIQKRTNFFLNTVPHSKRNAVNGVTEKGFYVWSSRENNWKAREFVYSIINLIFKTYEQVLQVKYKRTKFPVALGCCFMYTEFLPLSCKVTIGIIFLQNDGCYDNHCKFSFSETDVSFSWKLECEKPMGKINSNFNRTLTTT